MKRNLISAYLFDSELEKVLAASELSGWNKTETLAFFARWGLNHFTYNDVKEFNDAFNEELVAAQFVEYEKTPEWKMHIEKLLADKKAEMEKK